MKELLKNKDFLYLFVLNLFIIAGFILTYAHFGNILVDCGREAFLPTVAFDDKNVMYRDIFNLYPPLSYQFNGILYKFFGENLRVLYFAGLINTLIIISSLYYISRYFLGSYSSFLAGFFTIFYCIFGSITHGFEYIFPYAYAYVYAFSGFLISISFFLKYLKNFDFKYLTLSLFFMGFSVANKFEFSLTVLVYIFALAVFKPKLELKKVLFAVFCFFITPIISYGYLFYQGLNFLDIYNYIKFGERFFNSQGYKNFSTVPPIYFYNGFKNFVIECFGFILLFFYLTKAKKTNIIFAVFFTLISIFLYTIFYVDMNSTAFSWLSIPAIIIECFLGILCFKNFNKENFIFFLLNLAFLLSTIKINFFLAKFNYGYYAIPLFILVMIIFLNNYCLKIISQKKLNMFLSIFLISISLITGYLQTFKLQLQTKNYQIKTSNGTIYSDLKTGKPFNDTLNYISNNTPQDSTVLVLQEGVMLNFLTNRKTNLMLYHLINIHIEALGENYIVDKLNRNKPDYIVIIESEHITPKIIDFINKNYKRDAVFDKILIGKRKGL